MELPLGTALTTRCFRVGSKGDGMGVIATQTSVPERNFSRTRSTVSEECIPNGQTQTANFIPQHFGGLA